jgi:dihydrofolate reductase
LNISIIAAVGENGVIGWEGNLPWRLPDDLRKFKALTMGHHVIMGRKTYESLPGSLPGREILVVTRNRDYRASGRLIFYGLRAALDQAEAAGETEVFIGGGAQVYEQALPLASRMYLTRVQGSVEGDAFFPDYDQGDWEEVLTEFHPQDERHKYAFTFTILDRKATKVLNSS